MKWAVRIRYLESPITGDGKWHQHTTKWYDDSSDAWKEAEEYEKNRLNWYESQGGLMHKL